MDHEDNISGPDSHRNMDHGDDHSGQESPHSVQSIRSIPINSDAFSEMMIAVTQLIRDSQSQTGSSRGEKIDRFIKLFQDMRPPQFSGAGGPEEAENWLMKILKILDGMSCPPERRVTLATFALEGEAERWWQMQMHEKFTGRSSSQIQWDEFTGIFRDWFVPLSARRQMQDKFIRLIQGDRSVTQYEAEFTMLARYASQIIPNNEEKCHRFLSGLKDGIRQPLIPLGIDDYSVLVERARRIEIDLHATQRRRDFQKRKNPEGSKFSQGSQSRQSYYSGHTVEKKAKSVGSFSREDAKSCSKCGRFHRGECLVGSNACFWCHQPGHIARNCPTLGQRTPADSRMSTVPPQKISGVPPQRTYGRQRTVESSGSVPHPGQTQQNIQPRVYALTQQEAKDSPDVITGTCLKLMQF